MTQQDGARALQGREFQRVEPGTTSQALIDRDKDDAEKLKQNRAVIDAAKQQAYVGEARGSDVRRLVATEAQTGSKFGLKAVGFRPPASSVSESRRRYGRVNARPRGACACALKSAAQPSAKAARA